MESDRIGDISNSNGYVTLEIFRDMIRRFNSYVASKEEKPSIIYTTKPDYVTLERYGDMVQRYVAYQGKNGEKPNKIYINKGTPLPSKSAFHLMVEEHVGFQYNTWTEFFNGMSSKGYKYYNNDVYPQGEALDRLKNNSGLNCADVSQIGYAVATDLGLEAHYGHLKCQSGGHIVIIIGPIKGGTVYDLAKKISTTSGITGPNDYWCQSTGYFQAYDPKWLTGVDDGVT